MKTILILLTIVAAQVCVMQLVMLITERRKARLEREKLLASRQWERGGVERRLTVSYLQHINK